ncbi:42114_t:CDS:2 [Gigaspora margarita]|uniref:42114_t:CDS:1 n=1 Tax=Gigaspora margarita TaxID=4874 RepID=A0ABN7URK3_GIGMA|nr:42114_t:CDS:2 [Gigaspora margarita]
MTFYNKKYNTVNISDNAYEKFCQTKEPKYSSYCKVDKSLLVGGKVDTVLKRISSDADIDGDNDTLIGQQAIFTEQPGIDMISDFQGDLSHNQCIVNTNGDEVYFTDAVPYIKTSARPMEDVTSTVLWHKENAVSVQVDIYDVQDFKPFKYPNELHHDPMEINLGSNTERNRMIRISLFGKAVHRYDTIMFSKISDDFCYIISQRTLGLEDMESHIVTKPQEDDHIKKAICDAAVNASITLGQVIQCYNLQSSISLQLAEQAKWAATIGLSLVLETCGIEVRNKPFEMIDIDIPDQVYKLRTTSVGKGDGVPMMNSKAWNTMFPSDSLKGISKSPMAVANSIIYNNIVYSNELGRLMGPVDNLFLYDYAVESREKNINAWFSGARNKISLLYKQMTPLQATSTLGNVMGYEVIKAKCRVEEVSRRYSQINKKMAVWKDLRAMLHFRVVDAAFVKVVPFTMLTVDEMDAIGFATMLHDLVDLGYDVSVKESSNTFLTMTDGKIDIDSVKKGYIRMANGLQYVIEKYKYDACGLTFLSTHFWQMANGRHRVIPSIYNGATNYQHDYLEFKGTLLDVLQDKNFTKKDSISAAEAAENIRAAALPLGYDAIAMAELVTIDMAGSYTGDIEISPQAINVFERKMIELSTSLSIGCDVNGKMASFLWMICEYMWLKTGMMLSCTLGTLKIMHNRRQSDDRGGLQYKW